MAKSTEELLEDRISEVARHARSLTAGRVTRLTIDFQASQELPYRLYIPDESVPLVGVAWDHALGESLPD